MKVQDQMKDNGKTFVDRRIYLLTERAEFFKSFAPARSHMVNSGKYSEKELEAFDKLAVESIRKRASLHQDWLEDPELPQGWKKRERKGKSNRFSYLSPQGDSFKSLKDALKHLLETKSNKKTVEKLKPKLRQEGFKASGLLPKGWMVRQSPYKYQVGLEFLTSELHSLKCLDQALEWLKMSNCTKEDDLKNLRKFVRKVSEGIAIRKHSWEQDDSLPEGWKVRTVGLGSEHWKREHFCTNKRKVAYFCFGMIF